MAELVNLRTRRKQAKRQEDEQRSNANRLAHGLPKRIRKLEAEKQTQASRRLEAHRIDPGDRR
jgi:hypothetical protein